MKHFKNFQQYVPAEPLDNVMYLKSEYGQDWYDAQTQFAESSIKCSYNSAGEILAVDQDVSKIFPINASVLELAQLPENFALGTFVFNLETQTIEPKTMAQQRENWPEITPKQLRLVLLENGVNSKAVEAAIAAIEDETIREVAMIEWKYATGYQRNNANLIMIATELLGFDDLKIDAMWQSALLK